MLHSITMEVRQAKPARFPKGSLKFFHVALFHSLGQVPEVRFFNKKYLLHSSWVSWAVSLGMLLFVSIYQTN